MIGSSNSIIRESSDWGSNWAGIGAARARPNRDAHLLRRNMPKGRLDAKTRHGSLLLLSHHDFIGIRSQFRHKPRSSRQPQTLSLSDGVSLETFVHAEMPAGFRDNHPGHNRLTCNFCDHFVRLRGVTKQAS